MFPGGEVVEKSCSSQWMMVASSQGMLIVGAVAQGGVMQCHQQVSQQHQMTSLGASSVPPIFSAPAFLIAVTF